MTIFAPGFLFEREGELSSTLLVEHPVDAPPIAVSARYAGGERRLLGDELRFRSGLARIGLPTAAVARSVEVAVEQPGGSTLRETVSVPAARRQVAHLVHLAHQDPGWADRPRLMRDRMVPFLDEAVALADATAGYPDEARFRWNVESTYLLDDYVAARPPAAVERLVAAIRAGSIEVGGLYAGVQSEFAGAEQLFRSTDAGRRLAARHGIALRSAFLDDVPGFAWTLPTALAAAGVEHLVWGPDPIRALAQHNPEALYRLRGPDGRAGVLVWQAPYAYIEAWNLVGLAEGRRERAIAGLMERYADPAAYPHDQLMWMIAHDFNRPAGDLSELVRDWNRRWAFPRLRLSVASDFFDAALASGTPIPSNSWPYPDAWADGPAAVAQHTARKRAAQRRLPVGEALAAMTQLLPISTERWHERIAGMFPPAAMRYGKRPWIDYPAQELDDAYTALHLIDEHTYGSVEGDGPFRGFSRACWLEKERLYDDAERSAEILELSGASSIAREVAPRHEHSVVVINPLSFARAGEARFELPLDWLEGDAGITLADGTATTWDVERSDEAVAEVVAQTGLVPAHGVAVLRIGTRCARRSSARSRADVLDDGVYRVEIDPVRGGIARWLDQRLGAELLSDSSTQALGQVTAYLRDPAPFSVPDDFEDEGLSGREVWAVAGDIGRYMIPRETVALDVDTVEARDGANGRRGVRIRGRLGDLGSATIDVAIVPGAGRLELDVLLEKRRTLSKEAIHVAFPFALEAPRLELEGPGYVYEPGRQGPGSCFDWYVVHNWLAVSGDAAQVVLSPLDAPLVSVDEPRHDQWARDLPPFSGAITSYLANNSWWTNYPREQGGTIRSRYRLSTLPPTAGRAERTRAGWEASVPLVAYPVRADEAYGLLADGDGFLAVGGGCAMVVGLQADGTSHDGVPTLRVRLQEIAGTGGTCAIAVPPAIGAVTGAWRARSDGGRGEPLGVAGGVAHADLAASEVLQIVLDVQVRRR
jgi:alpha-mannosidase